MVKTEKIGKILCVAAFLMMGSILSSFPSAVNAAYKFNMGDRVYTTANLHVREGPGLSYTIIATELQGSKGVVVCSKPQSGDGYVWWVIKYADGTRGWSVEDGLEKTGSLSVITNLWVPYIHQCYDTRDSFDGRWACGATSAVMILAYYGKIDAWPYSCSYPHPHVSDYGSYVSEQYTSCAGYTFGDDPDEVTPDASGNPAKGAYGYIHYSDGLAKLDRMVNYFQKHELDSQAKYYPSELDVKTELNSGYPVPASTKLTSAGHWVVIKGYTEDGYYIVDDPNGCKPYKGDTVWGLNFNYCGEDVLYTWDEMKVGEKWIAIVHARGEPRPVITSSLRIIESAPYLVGDTITAEFTITNKGTAAIGFDVLTVGGRDPDDQVADFTWLRDITLDPDEYYNYHGTLTLTKAGTYHFFCAYRTPDGNWNTAIPTESGVTNVLDITVSLPPNTPPELSDGYVEPASGDTSTDFYYYVTYFDPDGDEPSVKQVYIDGVPYTMGWHSGLDSWATYRYGPKNLPAGSHTYYFYFEDGRGGTARLPTSGSYSSPTVNNPPNTPSNPSPSNHATGVSIAADLSWSGGDPDVGDTVTYDVYFGTTTTPPLVSNDQSATTYDLGTLSYSTIYYWKIVATDNHGSSTEGPIWDFTTQSAPPEYRTLTVYSSPSGVTFTVDGSSCTTPWSQTYSKGTSVSLVMPSTHSVAEARYYWDRWSDGVTSRSRTVTMDTDVTLTADYTGPYYQLTVTSSPITGIPFTLNGASKTTSYTEWLLQGSYTVEMPATYSGYTWSHWYEDGDTNRIKTFTLSSTKTLTAVYTTPARARLVVRGLDNCIYYRAYDSSLESWGSWASLPSATCDSPATAVCQNELHVVVRGMDGSSLWHGYLTNPADPASFSGWTLLSGATHSAPTLTSNGTVLCLVVRGLDNRIYHRCYNEGSWGSWVKVPTGATCDSPAAAMLGKDLHIVVRGFSTIDVNVNNTMWHIIIQPGGSVIRSWVRLSGATSSKPSLAANQPINRLYLVVRGMDNRVYWRTYDGLPTDSWGSWNLVATGSTIDGPGATVLNDQLHIVVRGMDGVSLWHRTIDLTSGTPSPSWEKLTGSTPSAPTLTS